MEGTSFDSSTAAFRNLGVKASYDLTAAATVDL